MSYGSYDGRSINITTDGKSLISEEEATPEQLEAAAARMIAQAASMRAAAALEPQSAGTVIRWSNIGLSNVKTLSYVAIKANGKWWTTRRNENSHGVPWSWLVKNYRQIRDGEFLIASGWSEPDGS